MCAGRRYDPSWASVFCTAGLVTRTARDSCVAFTAMAQLRYGRGQFVLSAAILLCVLAGVGAQQAWARWKRQVPPHEWNPWRSPLERFDKYVHVSLPFYGEFVKGFSIPMYLEDTVWDPYWSEYPQWFLRRINCFLGIPYAAAPIGERRFQVNIECWSG